MRYVVTVQGLFLRKTPVKEKGNERAVLPEGTKLDILDAAGAYWWHVSGSLNGVQFEGWVARKHLRPIGEVDFDTSSQVRAVHWRENNPKSTRNGPASASPLGETGMPRPPMHASADLDAIIDWLAVEQSRRYRPGNGYTYCNIYAYDVAYAASVYLPRVWWTDGALTDLAAGKTVVANYGATIREMNANAIHDWLKDHGTSFGWTRTFSLTDLQDCANRGGIATICALRKDRSRSGHIVIIAPETSTIRAKRDGAGKVVVPVQSQAGVINFRRKISQSAWWSDPKFSSFGLFVRPL